jgi:hypothetical protein
MDFHGFSVVLDDQNPCFPPNIPPKTIAKPHDPHHATDGSPGVHHLLSGAARVGGEEVARELVVLELFANLLGV